MAFRGLKMVTVQTTEISPNQQSPAHEIVKNDDELFVSSGNVSWRSSLKDIPF